MNYGWRERCLFFTFKNNCINNFEDDFLRMISDLTLTEEKFINDGLCIMHNEYDGILLKIFILIYQKNRKTQLFWDSTTIWPWAKWKRYKKLAFHFHFILITNHLTYRRQFNSGLLLNSDYFQICFRSIKIFLS